MFGHLFGEYLDSVWTSIWRVFGHLFGEYLDIYLESIWRVFGQLFGQYFTGQCFCTVFWKNRGINDRY